jgi:hypothetical protein
MVPKVVGIDTLQAFPALAMLFQKVHQGIDRFPTHSSVASVMKWSDQEVVVRVLVF